MPDIAHPVALPSFLGSSSDADLKLVFVPGAGTALDEIKVAPGSIDVLIGPEGGFSDQETEDSVAAGFRPVSLGPRVLRSETAAAAALAVLQSRWGDL